MTDGFLSLLKPPGMTSHDAVSFLRRTLGTKKIGHAGTLDPGAAGVLPLAIGRATRFIEYLDSVDKSYRAELLFGVETDSGDDTGRVVKRAADGWQWPSAAQLAAAIASLTGEITQTPPIYSAVKLDGRRAADLARKNIPVTIPPRQVTIYRLELLGEDRTGKTLTLDVDCSKGTYIRSLCTDLGRALDIPATMSFLVRTRVGDLRLADAYTPEEVAARGWALVRPVDELLAHLNRYELDPKRVKAFQNGLATRDRFFAGDPARPLAVYSDGVFLGVGRYSIGEQSVKPEKIYKNGTE